MRNSMMRRRRAIVAGFVVLALASGAFADTIELNLFDLGCPTGFDHNSPSWQTNFDLGVTFTEISHVYIDWSGQITAELVTPGGPLDGLFTISLYESDPHNYFAKAYTQAGADTFPQPEPFDLQKELTGSNWSMLLDGQANIEVWFGGINRPLNLITTQFPIGELDSATLVIDGTIIPEPASVFLFGLGVILARKRLSK